MTHQPMITPTGAEKTGAMPVDLDALGFSIMGMAAQLARAQAVYALPTAHAYGALTLAAHRFYPENADSALRLAWRRCCQVRDGILAERAVPDDCPAERLVRWRNGAYDAVCEFTRSGVRRRNHRIEVLRGAHYANACRGWPLTDLEVERAAYAVAFDMKQRAA